MESPSRPSLFIGVVAMGMFLLLGYFGQARIQRAKSSVPTKTAQPELAKQSLGLASKVNQKTSSDVPSIDEKISINQASASELESVLGIGPALAERIVDYRTKRGPFPSTKHLMLVKGIGYKTFRGIEKWLKL